MSASDKSVPAIAAAAALLHSDKLPEDTPQVHGYNFDNGVDYSALLQSFMHTGFQATHFAKAVAEVEAMV